MTFDPLEQIKSNLEARRLLLRSRVTDAERAQKNLGETAAEVAEMESAYEYLSKAWKERGTNVGS
jgi:hypothetical protein